MYDENKSIDSYHGHNYDNFEYKLNESFSSPNIPPLLRPTFSPISQLDAVSDFSFSTPPPQPLSSARPGSGSQSRAENVRTAPYNLNRDKQVSKLLSDAAIDDFTINVSPTEQNINIVCSTGFYSLVVLPTFSKVSVGYTTTAANVDIHCNDITGKVDSSKSNVNTVVFFKLNSTSSRTNNVTITLHHTVRKVQVQGSSIMNNNIRANVWFLENVLLGFFTEMSAAKSLDISQLNTLVSNVVANHLQKRSSQLKCLACDIPFTGRSQYEQCPTCYHHFHSRCLLHTSHQCSSAVPPNQHISDPQLSTVSYSSIITTQSTVPRTSTVPQPDTRPVLTPDLQPNNGPQLFSTTQQSPIPLLSTHPQPITAPMPTPAPPVSSDTAQPIRGTDSAATITQGVLSPPPPPLPNASATPSSAVPPGHRADQHSTPNSAGDPFTIVTVNADPLHGTSNARPAQAKPRGKKNANKHSPATDPASYELECNRKQIATAHAKIQELEIENTKLNKTNHILGERIKMFEGEKLGPAVDTTGFEQ